MSPPPSPACALEHWDSSALAPAERLAYWHDVAHNWVDVQPLSPGEQLQASWSLLRGADCFFGTKQSSAAPPLATYRRARTWWSSRYSNRVKCS